MTTIEEVARRAGVSVATVSRVLNGSGPVSPGTASRVQQAIDELGYTPNLTARNLRRKESRVVLALSPNFSNPYYAHILTGIGDLARSKGYSVFICNVGEDLESGKDALQMLKTHRADGAIFLACAMDDFWLEPYFEKYPIVQCCEYIPDAKASSVSIDNYRAAYEMTRYLAEQGHKRIGMISADNRYLSTRLRFEGCRDAQKDVGIQWDETLVETAGGDYSFASGHVAACRLLDRPDRPTALFCVSDILALSAVAAAEELGLSVPEDLTVTGFDDVDYTTMFHPYLTTVSQPCYAMGQRSLEMLLRRLRDPQLPPERVFVEHALVIRESSGKAPAGTRGKK